MSLRISFCWAGRYFVCILYPHLLSMLSIFQVPLLLLLLLSLLLLGLLFFSLLVLRFLFLPSLTLLLCFQGNLLRLFLILLILLDGQLIFRLDEHVRMQLVSFRIPRPDVSGKTVPSLTPMTVASPSLYEGRKAIRVDVLEELFLIATAEDVYFLSGFLVDPHLYHGPHSSEQHRGIDDEHAESIDMYSPRISG